jgi:hypothetical protein
MREEQNPGTSDDTSQDSSQQPADSGQTAPAQAGTQDLSSSTTSAQDGSDVEPLAPISGEGEATEVEAYGPSLSLKGVTRARFNGGSFRTSNVRTTAGTGCDGCDGRNCIQVSGTLNTDYRVTTTVTLPSVADFPDLTPCQRQRVQDAITNVLAPHEQQHVAAFNTYNGSTQQSFSTALCRDQFESFIRGMVAQEEGPRQSAAQSASDALDPFNFDVDLDCTD